MSLIVLTSATGAPGLTTTALGLALTWPRDVLLVDADRTPAQSVAAGYLRGQSLSSQGLLGVMNAHRERRDVLDEVVTQRVPLPEPPTKSDAPGPSRHFLPGFLHLSAVDSFAGAWGPLAEALRHGDADALADAGRMGHRGLSDDLVRASDLVAVVTRTSLRSLAALRFYLSALLEQADARRVGLLLVGPGRPYAAHEIAEQFGVPVLAEIAWQPAPADELCEGVPLGARWHRTPLARSYGQAARVLTARLDADRALVGSPA